MILSVHSVGEPIRCAVVCTLFNVVDDSCTHRSWCKGRSSSRCHGRILRAKSDIEFAFFTFAYLVSWFAATGIPWTSTIARGHGAGSAREAPEASGAAGGSSPSAEDEGGIRGLVTPICCMAAAYQFLPSAWCPMFG